VKHLVDPATPDALEDTAECLLVMRVLQTRRAAEVAEALGYPSDRQCMRALGEAVTTLVALYGPAHAREELDRYG
jgi:tRNA(Met) cytidine acetyltransferase